MNIINIRTIFKKRNIGGKSIIILIVTLCLCFFIIGTRYYLYHITEPPEFVPNLSDNKYFIAHATGSMDGYTYLNSKESLMNSLDKDYKFIEIDLQYTSDSVLVCVHDWELFNKISIPDITGNDSNKIMRVPSLNEFKNRRIYGKYTPLTLNDVISIQEEHPFVIVIDKTSNADALNKYFKKEKRKNVMVEVFSEDDYKEIKDSGYVPMLSIGWISKSDCITFIAKHPLAHNYEWFTTDYHSDIRCLRLLKKLYGAKIAVYTVNSAKYYTWSLDKGVDKVYTDNWDMKNRINTFQDNSTH